MSNKKSYPGQTLAAAVAARCHVAAGSKQEMKFVLAWDHPVIKFGSKSDVHYCRFHCLLFALLIFQILYYCLFQLNDAQYIYSTFKLFHSV